jgi:hypothetical protein
VSVWDEPTGEIPTVEVPVLPHAEPPKPRRWQRRLVTATVAVLALAGAGALLVSTAFDAKTVEPPPTTLPVVSHSLPTTRATSVTSLPATTLPAAVASTPPTTVAPASVATDAPHTTIAERPASTLPASTAPPTTGATTPPTVAPDTTTVVTSP